MTKSKFRPIRIIGFLLVLTAVGAVIWCCYAITMAFQDNYKDKYTLTETDSTLLSTTMKAAIVGKPFDITEVQVNTFLNKRFCTEQPENGNGLKNIRLYFHKNDDAEMYAKVQCYGYDLAIYSKAKLSFDSSGTLIISLHDAKVGELEVNDKVLEWVLQRAFKDSKKILTKGTTLTMSVSYHYDINGINISLSLRSFKPMDGHIHCQTNNLTLTALKALKEYCETDEGRQKLSELFGWDLDDLRENLIRFLR